MTGRTLLREPSSPSDSATPTFSWDSVTGASRYMLQVATVDGNVVIREDVLTENVFQAPSSLTAGSYRVWVKAINAATDAFSDGVWSSPFDFEVA